MSKKIERVSFVEASVLPPTYNLENQNSEAEHIRLDGEEAFHCILRSNVATII